MRRPRGLTLFETMVAIVLLAVAALGLAGTLTYGLRLTSQTSQATAAAEVGRTFLETTRANVPGLPATAVSFDGFAPTPSVAGFPPLPYPAQSVGGETYTLKVNSAPVSGRTDLVLVQVDVFWSATEKIELSTIFYRP